MTLRNSVGPGDWTRWRSWALAGVALSALLIAPTASLAQSADPSDVASPAAPKQRMMVEADNLIYDVDSDTVSAIGKVVIYYGPYTLVADRVDVDRKSNRVTATGSVELSDEKGNVVRGASVDLTDDFRDGVINAVEVVSANNVAFKADRVTRTGGDVTTFENGVYLPCVDCNGTKGREPIWHIRSNRIIHRQGDKTVTLEGATFEFAGVPLIWLPALTQPDPTVRRQSGLLMPTPSYKQDLGFGIKQPYFYALAPNMDVTFSPTYYTRQGALIDTEWRHQLIDGAYSIRLAGIHQNDPGVFSGTSGDREWRGSIESEGKFRINDRWNWGWSFAWATDRSFFDDYDQPKASDDAVTNDLFLTGVDGRNRFDAHAYSFFVQQEDSANPNDAQQTLDLQAKQPFVHPVIDYKVYAPEPVMGGEFSLTTNFTSLSREQTDLFEYDSDGDGDYGTDDPDETRPTRLRGASGTFGRGSINALWRRRFVDSVGQVFTPFAYFRGDAFFGVPDANSGLPSRDVTVTGRALPAVGLEYSYPIEIKAPFGNQVIEPIAQLIMRPDEMEIGKLVNEDAQSLVFDATSLFDYDKFSGYDRAEGGTRLNVGMKYSAQFVNGMDMSGTIGQSIHLAGVNSFAVDTVYGTGADSGLEGTYSDYVASLNVDTNQGLLVGSSARFDHEDFNLNRLEAQAIGLMGPLTTTLTYAYARAQPKLGLEDDRSDIQMAANLRMNENWRMFGGTRYDIMNSDFVRYGLGVGYDSEEFSMSLSYSEDLTQAGNINPDRTIYLRLGFRSLGDVSSSVDIKP